MEAVPRRSTSHGRPGLWGGASASPQSQVAARGLDKPGKADSPVQPPNPSKTNELVKYLFLGHAIQAQKAVWSTFPAR